MQTEFIYLRIFVCLLIYLFTVLFQRLVCPWATLLHYKRFLHLSFILCPLVLIHKFIKTSKWFYYELQTEWFWIIFIYFLSQNIRSEVFAMLWRQLENSEPMCISTYLYLWLQIGQKMKWLLSLTLASCLRAGVGSQLQACGSALTDILSLVCRNQFHAPTKRTNVPSTCMRIFRP